MGKTGAAICRLLIRLCCSAAAGSPQGLLAPAGSRTDHLQLQNNGAHLAQLQRRFGVPGRELLGAQFIAGSMFAGGWHR